MTSKVYTVEDFTHEMLELIGRESDDQTILDRGSALLERLIDNRNCISAEYRVPAARPDRPRHGSYLLYRSPELLVTTEVWGPGDHVGPHDHHTWGMIGVLENELHEVRFRRLDDGSDPKYASLEEDRQTVSKPGEVSLLIPGIDEIHQIDNPDYRPTVEIHVYGRDLGTLSRCRFDPETGLIRPFTKTLYDNE